MALTDVKSEQIQSSVALAGSPTTTTQSASDNSTKIATTAYVETAVANLVASAPAALNTLDELAAALNDDASFSTNVTNSIATKLPLAGGTLTGALTINHADGLLVHDTNGTASNRLKFLYNGTSGVATLGPHSTGGNTSLVIGTSNSGTFTTALTINNSQAATFAGTISSGAITTSGNVSVGGSAYTTSADLNLLGDGLAIKNDKSGSNNNWSLIQNTATSSAANLAFTTGLGVALTLNHDKSATFGGTISSGSITATGSLNSTSTSGLGIQTSGYSFLSAANNARAASGSIRLGNGAGSTGFVIDYTDQGQTVATIRNVYVQSNSSELTIQSPFITFDTGTSYTEALKLDHNQNAIFSGNVGIGGSPDSDSGLHLKGDGKRILIDSTDENLVSLGRRGSSGAGLDKAYLRMRNAGTNTVVIDTDGISYFNGGTLAVGTTSTVGSSAELFVVSGTGSAHSRFLGNSDTYSTVYIKNSSTTANTNQPFLTFQDTGGNRGNLGLRYSTAQLVIQGHGGVGIAAGSGGISNSSDLFVKAGGNVGVGTTNPRYNLTVEGNNATAVGIGVDNVSGSSTLDIAALGSGYANHQAGAGEVWFYSPDNINIGGATGNTNDIKFLANNAVNMVIKGSTGNNGSSGNVGIGVSNPNDARLEIYQSVNDTYTWNGFLEKQHIRLKHANVANNYGGIGFSNSAGNYEWFVGANQTSASPAIADFVIQGADSTSSYTENMRITCKGLVTTPYNLFVDATLSANQGISGWTKVGHNQKTGTNNGGFNTSTHRFTAPVAGKYLVSVTCYLATSGISYIYTGIWKNGSAYRYIHGQNSITTGTDWTYGGTIQIYLAQNDYIEHFAYSNTTATLGSGTQRTSFSIYLIG